jgi:hypothetical protein
MIGMWVIQVRRLNGAKPLLARGMRGMPHPRLPGEVRLARGRRGGEIAEQHERETEAEERPGHDGAPEHERWTIAG